MADRQPDSNIEFAGDYFLKYIHLRNHAGQGIKASKGEDINFKVIEFNITIFLPPKEQCRNRTTKAVITPTYPNLMLKNSGQIYFSKFWA